jgi:chemotaxis protein MotA
MAKSVENAHTADAQYMNCIKLGIIGHMQGYAPQISVEFARKSLSSKVRPSFPEMEEMLADTPVDAG